MDVIFILEVMVVLGAIVMGTRASGIGVGVWGGVGTFVLIFVFGEAPGEPPTDAIAIILGVVTAAALMQAAGGIDWMVAMAARVIERRPRQITFLAPLTAFLFSVGAGTGNIIYPLLPVIYDVSYRNRIRPARPLTVTVVQSGIALAASPVSAAMAAMLTLTDVAPYNLGLGKILAITFPSCVIGILVTSFVVNRMWRDMDDDPEIQARIASGALPAPTADAHSSGASAHLTYTSRGRNAALAFLLGVATIVVFGLFPDLRPSFTVDGETTSVSMTVTIVLVMLVAAAVIMFVGRPKVDSVPGQSVFKAGMISAIALFGIAWLTATFIEAHEDYIVSTVGSWVTDWKFLFAVAVFLVAAMTTSQSTATRTIVPIGLAAGLPPGIITGMWGGALGGVYTLPANGPQIAAANFDLTGSTKLGTKLIDHSFFIPMLVLVVTTVASGAAIGAFF
ncbi:anaerobic C4-dicarboxylate transporter family protein [Demequina globuliformis]|uniref:anaerobic C4-dicarboxylate transporter family protein n=1 Tax=Demequina globuliformis TaxID=676202 RepID=UPI0007860857|nr:anaerobic C4-dicarboxylate transporter family protein [Demequina globuliformis]